MENRSIIIAHLKAVAALAESTAIQLEHNKFWPGELSSSLAKIRQALSAAESESDDRGR